MARFRYRVNMSRASADKLKADAANGVLASNIAAAIRAAGFRVNNGPATDIADLSTVWYETLTGARSTAQIGVVVNRLSGTAITESDTRNIDLSVFNALRNSARAQWSINAMIAGLPRVGSGEHRMGILTGDIALVSRTVDNGSSASPDGGAATGILTPETTVTASNSPENIGRVNRSGTGAAIDRARIGADNLLEKYRTPIIVGAVVVGLVTATILVKNVKAIVA